MNIEWEDEMAELEQELAHDPRDALPELADFVEEILDARGLDLTRETASEDEAGELATPLLSAREIADEVARGEDVEPRQVETAIAHLRAIYRYALGERPAA